MNNSVKDKTLVIAEGTVITETEALPMHDVIIRNGKIVEIRPSDQIESDAEVVNARGAFVAPGMIDVHSDFIETVASPRPSVVMDIGTSLINCERELIAHGITTMYHSLSLYGRSIFDHKPIRSFENVETLIENIQALRLNEGSGHLVRHRLHLRIEADAVQHFDRIKSYIESSSVDMISFMDHTPGQGQYANLEVFSHMLKGYRNISDAEVQAVIASQQSADKLSLVQMMELASLAHERGISVASHDDDSLQKLECMEALNVAISEFPITMEVAEAAREKGMFTLAGAPNVMLGYSHSGNLSAREAVAQGAINMLCSDYYPSAMLSAVFTLRQCAGIDLSQAFALVTANPAKAAGIGDQLGSIAVGKAADILLVRKLPASNVPVVAEAFLAGRKVFSTPYPIFEESRKLRAGDKAEDRTSATGYGVESLLQEEVECVEEVLR